MKKSSIRRKLKSVGLGDLVRLDWFDASTGSSLEGGAIDVPVSSWCINLGVLGEKNKHIILAQNNFRFTNGLYDVDFTAIPLSWTAEVTVCKRQEVSSEDAKTLLTSFLKGHSRTLKRKMVNHEKPR